MRSSVRTDKTDTGPAKIRAPVSRNADTHRTPWSQNPAVGNRNHFRFDFWMWASCFGWFCKELFLRACAGSKCTVLAQDLIRPRDVRFSNRATSKAHVIDHCPSLVLPKVVATWPSQSDQRTSSFCPTFSMWGFAVKLNSQHMEVIVEMKCCVTEIF